MKHGREVRTVCRAAEIIDARKRRGVRGISYRWQQSGDQALTIKLADDAQPDRSREKVRAKCNGIGFEGGSRIESVSTRGNSKRSRERDGAESVEYILVD